MACSPVEDFHKSTGGTDYLLTKKEKSGKKAVAEEERHSASIKMWESTHGSWLNIAENELSAITRQCVSKRRIGSIEELREETAAWCTDVNNQQKGVDWQMKIDDARCKLKSVYPKIREWLSTRRVCKPALWEGSPLVAIFNALPWININLRNLLIRFFLGFNTVVKTTPRCMNIYLNVLRPEPFDQVHVLRTWFNLQSSA